MSKQGAKGIEWCDRTVNVVHGCTPVVHPDHPSACERCYAQRMASRLKGRYGYPVDEPFRVVTRPYRLPELLKAKPGERVFVASMGDLFHRDVPDEFIAAVFGCFTARLDVTYIVLTKRTARMRAWFKRVADAAKRCSQEKKDAGHWPWVVTEPMILHAEAEKAGQAVGLCDVMRWPLPNVWLLATTESQHWANERVSDLLACPAAVHGVSVEGMLGPVDLSRWLDRLGWVICGAEQGQRARPFDWAWARDLRDQCAEAGVPFFFKRGPGRSEPPADMMIRQWPGGER